MLNISQESINNIKSFLHEADTEGWIKNTDIIHFTLLINIIENLEKIIQIIGEK